MKNTIHVFSACCLAASLLTACSSSNNDPDPMVEVATTSARYQGNYQSDCLPTDNGGAQVISLSLVDNIGTRTTVDHNAINCSNAVLTVVDTFEVTFPGGTQEVAFPGDGEDTTTRLADFLDLRATGVTINGEVQDLSGVPEENLLSYDIVILVDAIARFGNGMGDTPEDRPTELGTIAYVRQ